MGGVLFDLFESPSNSFLYVSFYQALWFLLFQDLASHGGGSTDNQDSEKLSDQSDIPSQELCKDKIMAFLGYRLSYDHKEAK